MFRRHHLQQGKSLNALAYRAPLYPLTPILGFLLCLMACIGLAFDPTQRIALWCGIPFVLLCYGAYHVTHKNKKSPEAEEANDVA
jgi:S-methylmethionine transporter